MRVLDFIILRIFLLQIFFFNYVYARYPLVSSAYVEFKEQWLADCGSITYIPLTPPKKNCDKEDNPFRGAHIEEMEENERKKCKKPQDSNSSLFDKNILHDVLFLCRHDEICDDLAEEIVIVKVWNRIVNQKPFENKCGDIFEYNQYKCPFTSRIDIQEYVQKNEIKKNLNYNELCTDKYGRTYPPPVGLGGKCVMFQREYPENGELVTEVIMPLDKRDMVERISQLPKDHELRTNETTLERFFPNGDTETSDDSTCMSLHVNKEAFIHCVYAPGDSDSFYLSSRTHFFCPKNISVTKSFLQSHLKSSLLGYEDEAKYETRNIDEGKFEFSEYCYIATDFTPTVLPDDDVRIELVAKFVGSKQSECNEKQIIEAKNGTSKEDYGKKLLESIGEFCPWENNTTYTVSF
uniref:Uncharacterized protein n=1 Tax=Panagrolaimus sp. ES5 TaxID=591445 RepID=A0AC34GQS2_9BILA